MQRFLKSNKILIAIVICLLAIGASSFIPVTEKDYIVINAPMNNIMSSIQQVSNWKKWHPELQSENDSAKIDVLTITPFGILVKETKKDKEALYSLVVIPSDTSNTSKVEIRFRTTLARLIFDELKNLMPSSLNPILKALRQYLENTQSYYGFPYEGRYDGLLLSPFPGNSKAGFDRQVYEPVTNAIRGETRKIISLKVGGKNALLIGRNNMTPVLLRY